MQKKNLFLSLVIPIMNEEGNIEHLNRQLQNILEQVKESDGVTPIAYEIIFVDDGSSDSTLQIIQRLSEEDNHVRFLSFSRNFGHQIALKAGLDHAKGDCVISMDGDCQHPPELVPILIEKWREGFDVVYTIRQDDPHLGYFKRMTSKIFYTMMNFLSDVSIDPGSADFRLLDRSVVEVIQKLSENPIFFRGMIKWLGFKQIAVPYMPHQRFWGKSKYSFKKMFRLAFNGITSFSVKPLHISTILGITISAMSFLYAIYAIYLKIFTDYTIPGWTSLLILISFIGGIQLLMIGILGEYIGKLFIEQKRRPPYIVREKNCD